MKYPVFVISKGRPFRKYAPIFRCLKKHQVDFQVVLEPQDIASYTEFLKDNECFKGIIKLDENDKGIAYARQFLLYYCRDLGIEKYWQLDDTVKAFFEKLPNEKRVMTSAKIALEEIEKLSDSYEKIALAGPNYEGMAFADKREIIFNTGVYSCVLTRTDTGINYELNLQFGEDLIFNLRHLKKGWNTLLSNKYLKSKKVIGKTPVGGLSKMYADEENYIKRVYHVISLFPKYLSFNKRKEGFLPNTRCKWRLFRRRIRRINANI